MFVTEIYRYGVFSFIMIGHILTSVIFFLFDMVHYTDYFELIYVFCLTIGHILVGIANYYIIIDNHKADGPEHPSIVSTSNFGTIGTVILMIYIVLKSIHKFEWKNLLFFISQYFMLLFFFKDNFFSFHFYKSKTKGDKIKRLIFLINFIFLFFWYLFEEESVHIRKLTIVLSFVYLNHLVFWYLEEYAYEYDKKQLFKRGRAIYEKKNCEKVPQEQIDRLNPYHIR